MILIDEWVAYARSLVGRDDLAGGTFDDQFTFAQSLTEAVKGTPGVLLAISIPASESGDDAQPVAGNAEEVGGAHGLEALKRLQNVVRRVADQWRPASPNEAYHIVRQRLFVTPDADALASISATARGFVEMYHRYADEFPREARDGSYEDRIKQTYPIHPELFDRLYEDWSSLERFQRTRGVLRLMNTVIHALWVGEDQSPLIMPGVDPDRDRGGELRADAVPAGLVEGGHRRRRRRPELRARQDRRGQAAVRAALAHPTSRAHRVLRRRADDRLGAQGSGDPARVPRDRDPGRRAGQLPLRARRARPTGRPTSTAPAGRYWYDLQANISRRAKDQAERLHAEEVYKEIARATRRARRRPAETFAGVHVCPEDAADIPDIDEARLVILHPKLTHKRGVGDSDAIAFAKSATEHRGAANRTYRNMLVYLAGDGDRIEELERSVREYLGWSEILAKEDDLNLTTSQRNQATERQAKASETDRRAAARRLPVGARPDRAADRDPGDEGRGPGDVAGRARQPPARQRRRARRPARRAGDPPPARHDRRQAVGGRAHHRGRALAAVRRVPIHAAAARPRGARRGPHRPAAAVGTGGLRARRRLRRGDRRSTARWSCRPTACTVAVTDATLIVRPERAKAQRAAELPADEARRRTGSGRCDSSGAEPQSGARHAARSPRQDAVLREQAPAGRPLRIGLQEARRRGPRPARSDARRDAQRHDRDRGDDAGRIRRREGPDGLRERDDAEVRAERVRGGLT